MKKILVTVIAILSLSSWCYAFDINNKTEDDITIKFNGVCSKAIWGTKGLFQSKTRTVLPYEEIKQACQGNKNNCKLVFFGSDNCMTRETLTLTVDVECGVIKSTHSRDNEWPHNAAWYKDQFLMIYTVS